MTRAYDSLPSVYQAPGRVCHDFLVWLDGEKALQFAFAADCGDETMALIRYGDHACPTMSVGLHLQKDFLARSKFLFGQGGCLGTAGTYAHFMLNHHLAKPILLIIGGFPQYLQPPTKAAINRCLGRMRNWHRVAEASRSGLDRVLTISY